MVTVGYGDIHPVNRYEMLVGVFCMMGACGTFGYSVEKELLILFLLN